MDCLSTREYGTCYFSSIEKQAFKVKGNYFDCDNCRIPKNVDISHLANSSDDYFVSSNYPTFENESLRHPLTRLHFSVLLIKRSLLLGCKDFSETMTNKESGPWITFL